MKCIDIIFIHNFKVSTHTQTAIAAHARYINAAILSLHIIIVYKCTLVHIRTDLMIEVPSRIIYLKCK